MPGSLTVRNLTAQLLTLKTAEHFGTPKGSGASGSQSKDGKVSSLTSNITNLMKDVVPGKSGGSKKKPRPTLPDTAKPLKKDDVDVSIEPFRTKRIQTPTPANQVSRLTFQGEDGENWRIDVPTPSGTSTTLTPVSPMPGREYTGIYAENSSTLALFDSTNLKRWMEYFPDSTPLSALSIPGTHNSPTCHKALPSVRCHVASPMTQLENGVRFFDVRVQVDDASQGSESPALQLVHSAFPISLTGKKEARELFDDIYDFLRKNPTETLLLSLKREGRGIGTDEIFSERLQRHYINSQPQRWHTGHTVPTLGEVRGKIVLLRRFHLSDQFKHGHGFGIDATDWGDNTPNHTGGHIQVQDFYEVTDTENIEKKIKLVCDHFERAGAATHPMGIHATTGHAEKQPLFINFLSASNFWKPGCWPEKIAAKLNPAVTAFLCEKHDVEEGDGGLGVVVCDWVGENGDWDLVRAVVGMNSRLLLEVQDDEGGEDEGEGSDPARRGRRRGGRDVRRGRARGRGRVGNGDV